MSRIICPFCFNPVDESETDYLCCSTSCSKDSEEDKIYDEYQRGNKKESSTGSGTTINGHIVTNEKLVKNGRKVICDKCHKPLTIALCPKCHNRIDFDINIGSNGSSRTMFSILGPTGGGKSVYVTTLIHKIEKMANEFNWSIQFSDHMIGSWKLDNDNIYESNKLPDPTERHISMVHKPLVFNFKMEKTRQIFNIKKSTTIQFPVTFYDTAGEESQSQKELFNIGEFIRNSGGIFFILDPTQMKGSEVQSQNTSNSITIDYAKIIGDVAETYRIGRMKKNDKIDVPIAIILSKADLLMKKVKDKVMPFTEGTAVYEGIRKKGIYDEEYTKDIYDDVWGYLQNNSPNLVKTVENNFKNYCYFAVAALGNSYKSSGSISEPYKVEDPFIWMLHQNGYL